VACKPNKLGRFSKFWPYVADPRRHNVQGISCDTNHEIDVYAYSDRQWKIALSYDFDLSNLLSDDGREPNLSLEVEIEDDGNKQKYSIKDITKAKKDTESATGKSEWITRLEKMVAAVMVLKSDNLENLDKLIEKDEKGPFSFKSAVSLNFEWGWKEVETSQHCEYEIKGGFEANPILELKFEKDFLGSTAVLGVPVVGPFIYSTKKLLDILNAGELSLKFSIEGSLGLTIASATYKLSKTGNDFETVAFQLNGKISFKLEAKIEADMSVTVFYIKVGGKAGAIVGAEAGFKMNDDSALRIRERALKADVILDFTGLEVYAKAYYECGISFNVEGELPESAAARSPMGGNLEGEIEQSAEDELEKKGHIIEPKEKFWKHSFDLID
jgi:hypothetical protein